MALPEEGSGRATTFVDNDGHHVAALVHDAALAHQPDLLEVVCAAANVALERERLQAELEARVVELQASRERIVDGRRRRAPAPGAQPARRRPAAPGRHRAAAQPAEGPHPERSRDRRAAGQDGGRRARPLAGRAARARARHPPRRARARPRAALDSLAARAAVPTKVLFETSERLPEPVELAAYFVASEALANVAKYAQATTVSMRVWRSGRIASIEIADDGIGGANDAGGSGLRGLADRVEALEGRLRVSSPAGAGTVVTAELPCEA